ncbi:MAG: ACT domain-containing protein [Rhodobacteraceae bacterium]|nr:ACT domain-containing protein [Paracoccaceae bacterium]
MPKTVSSAYDMISTMTPVARSGDYVFISTKDPALIALLASQSVATCAEDEGVSMLISVALAEKSNLNVDQPMRWITLNVYSALEGVGLTAAVSAALADSSIPCNMIAAFHHDHVFVPAKMQEQAMDVLISLQENAAAHKY